MIAPWRWTRAGLLTVALTASSACYSYHPIQDPSPGATVRIRVPLTSAVTNRHNDPETLDLEGVVLEAPADSLIMVTENRRELGTFKVLTSKDTIRVARSGLAGMDERVYSSAKTYGFSALLAAGVAGVVLAVLEAGGGQGGSGPGSPGTQSSIRVEPIFSALWKLVGG